MDINQIRSMVQTREIHGRKLDFLSLSSVSEAIGMVRDIPDQKLRAWGNSGWVGLGVQKIRDYYESGRADSALAAFNAAKGRIDQALHLGGEVRPAVTGAWIMPLVLQSHPLSARLKARTKLPPLHITVNVEIMSWGEESILANCGATIARAMRQYQLDGGIASLKVIHWSDYALYNRANRGICIETQVDLSNENALAVAISPVYARGTLYPLMDWISSNTENDSLPRYKDVKKLSGYLEGSSKDYRYLESLGFKVEGVTP